MSETRAKTVLSSYVIASGGSPTVSRHLRPAPAPTPSKLYFYLQIVGEEFDLENDSGPQLQPGQTIRLRVSTSENQVSNQLGWVLRGDIELILQCEESCIQIAQPRMCIPYELLAEIECEFEITPAPVCPRGNAAFKVFVRDLFKDQYFPVTTFERYIAGNVNRDLLDSVYINMGTESPEYVAILHIEEQRTSQQLRLTCGSLGGAPLSVELPKPTRKIGLSEFVEDKVQPSLIRGTISGESRQLNQELLAWLQRLYGQYGSKLCLIIADHTDTELPWEMMQFDHGKHLGAMVAVSRWIPIPGFRGVRELSLAEQEFSGSVVAHLNEHDIKNTESERQALTLINADFNNTADALRRRLQKPLQGVGAVYLACHGIFSYGQRYEIALGQHSLTNPSSQIFAVELEDLRQSEEARPLFFVNACHSARLLVDEQGRCGLPEVALGQFANAYIGTLGPVGMEYAARIGQEMLQRAASQEGINPAEELRRLRAKAVERVEQDPSDKNQCELIYAFMYVYYGNPMARLRLSGLPLTDQQEANK